MCDKTEKRVFYLVGTAACFKSSILSRLNEEGVCYKSSSDLSDLRESFPALYTRKDGVQFNTIAVSYTHLDVYKRQSLNNVSGIKNFFFLLSGVLLTQAVNVSGLHTFLEKYFLKNYMY